jgi:hypothetical protein
VGGVNNVFFETGFEGSTCLTNVRFVAQSREFGKLLGRALGQIYP